MKSVNPSDKSYQTIPEHQSPFELLVLMADSGGGGLVAYSEVNRENGVKIDELHDTSSPKKTAVVLGTGWAGLFLAAKADRHVLATDEWLQAKGTNNVYALGDRATINRHKVMEDISAIFQNSDKDNFGALTVKKFQAALDDICVSYPQMQLYLKNKKGSSLFDQLKESKGDVAKESVDLNVEKLKSAVFQIYSQMKSLPVTAQDAVHQCYQYTNAASPVASVTNGEDNGEDGEDGEDVNMPGWGDCPGRGLDPSSSGSNGDGDSGDGAAGSNAGLSYIPLVFEMVICPVVDSPGVDRDRVSSYDTLVQEINNIRCSNQFRAAVAGEPTISRPWLDCTFTYDVAYMSNDNPPVALDYTVTWEDFFPRLSFIRFTCENQSEQAQAGLEEGTEEQQAAVKEDMEEQ